MNKIQELTYLVATALVENPGEAAVYMSCQELRVR